MKKEEQKEKKECNHAIYASAIATCVAIVLLLFMAANTAALVVEKDVGTLTSEADTIVIGNVTGLQSQWEEGKIFTYITISARDYIKGAKEGEITIKVPGGMVGDISCYVTDTPAFEKGEKVLTFLRKEDNYFVVVGCYQGKYAIKDEKITVSGKKIALEKVASTIKDKITAGKGGEIETAAKIIEGVEETLNPELLKTFIPVDESKTDIAEVAETVSSNGWASIKYEGFEGTFPNDWGVYGNPTWDDDDYKPYAGSWSGWCANGGTSGVDPEYNNYPNNMDAWMVYGPFSLSEATDARLTFYHWTQTENNYDYFYYGASTDGSSFLGTTLTGDWTPWEQRTLDLSDYCGESQVWIGFYFGSDGSVTYKGTFLDEIYLEKTVDGDLPSPAITNVEINPPSCQINLGDSFTVRVDGTNNGGDANGASSISLSFPQLDDTGDNSRVEYVSHDFNPSAGEYILDPPANPGVTTIWHKDTGEMIADYVLAEGGTSYGDWSSGEDHFLTLQVTPKEVGTFYFYVRETLNTTTGGLRITDPSSSSYTDQQGYKVYRYAVQVDGDGCEDEYEPDNSPAEASWITTDGISQTLHTFEPAGDHDWVKFNAVSGMPYRIETSNLGSNSDTYIYLYDTDGTTEIDHDDDGGVGLASKIEWPCTSAGTYYVMAKRYGDSVHGCDTNYDISVTEDDDYPHIDSITPNSGPANATQLGSDTAASDSTRVTIQGANFSASEGSAKFWRLGPPYLPDDEYHDAAIESWSNSQIVCRVPGGVSSYNKPDGSGNVYVMTSDGRTSNDANFRVTYSYAGSKWPGNSMTYYVNPNTADCTGEETAVQAAANTWNSAGADFSFVYGGTTSKTSVAPDGENSIIWKDYGYTGWLARNYIYATGGTVTENDIEFSDYHLWDTSGLPSISQYDVQSIATHELGHCLVLDDLYGSADSEKMMYGIGDSELVKRDLHPDDIAGIGDIYGTGGTPTLQVSVSESPDPVTSGGTSQVTVHVASSADGSPVQGASVTVSATCGSIIPPASGPTDSNGDFKPTYQAPTVTSTTPCTISATASKTGYNSGSDSDQIIVNPDGGQTVVRIDPTSQTVPTGPFTVTVTVDPAVPIAGTQFDLSFNPALVSANSVTEGNLLNQGGASTYFNSGIIDNTAGTITGVAGAITTPGQTVTSSGVFATIQMTAKSVDGTSPLDLSNVIVGDINGNPVSITVNDGTVTVEPCIGDLNHDGNVNVLDMIRVGQHWGETGTPGWIPEDVKKDGVINVLDMIQIGQHWGPCP